LLVGPLCYRACDRFGWSRESPFWKLVLEPVDKRGNDVLSDLPHNPKRIKPSDKEGFILADETSIEVVYFYHPK
jgi:hypothetical protein